MLGPAIACRARLGLMVLRSYVALITGMRSNLVARAGTLSGRLIQGSERTTRSNRFAEFSEQTSAQILEGPGRHRLDSHASAGKVG
jgi:hypothetical protein